MEVLASEIATILENDSLEMMLTNSILVKDDTKVSDLHTKLVKYIHTYL